MYIQALYKYRYRYITPSDHILFVILIGKVFKVQSLRSYGVQHDMWANRKRLYILYLSCVSFLAIDRQPINVLTEQFFSMKKTSVIESSWGRIKTDELQLKNKYNNNKYHISNINFRFSFSSFFFQFYGFSFNLIGNWICIASREILLQNFCSFFFQKIIKKSPNVQLNIYIESNVCNKQKRNANSYKKDHLRH